MSRFTTLRRRIADSPRLNAGVARSLARHIGWCHRTCDWESEGLDEMMQAVRSGGPIIFVVWHQRLLMTPFLFDIAAGPFSTLTSSARAGRMAGQILGQFGFDTLPMSSHKRHVALSREVLRRFEQGHSLGIAADGPRGPARVSSGVPLVWARMTGARVFCAAFAQARTLRLPTWDKMMLPLPYGHGALVAQEWHEAVPKRADAAETERLRLSIETQLEAVTTRADTLAARR